MAQLIKEIRSDFGRRLKELKIKKGFRTDQAMLDQINDFAKQYDFEISLSGLRRILNGFNSPQIETLFMISKALDISLDWLVTGESENDRLGKLRDGILDFQKTIKADLPEQLEQARKLKQDFPTDKQARLEVLLDLLRKELMGRE